MSGTVEGAAKARDTNIRKYGQGFYKRIGAKGGTASNTGGFAYLKRIGDLDKIRLAGAKGGAISRRGASIKYSPNAGEGFDKGLHPAHKAWLKDKIVDDDYDTYNHDTQEAEV